MTNSAEREAFEAHIKTTAWYQVLSQAKDEDDEGASVFRMARMAADAAWQARAALLEPVGEGWQPIETAPKDGSEILLSNGVVVHEGHWLHDEGGIFERRDMDGRYIDQDEREGYDGWIDWSGGMLPEPTHWQPLPAASPKSNGGMGS